MEATDDISGRIRNSGLLYPLMVIAAIAVIVFCMVGIATMMGWMPRALSGSDSATTAVAGAQRLAAADSRTGSGAPAARALPAEPRSPASAQAAPDCRECGVIESIRAVEVKGESSWMGAGGGAAVGALVGSQVGSGRGTMLASGVGAGAGAYAGTQIEQHLKKSVKYQVRVRMDDGKLRTFYRSQQPAYAVGQKVRVTDRGIVAAG